ncbi:MAG TPA: NUDIX hydrolase [Hyphomicrobiales bacterium]|nr:NUDIX hydrolase [Hyphomicrobiales bacterium]
MNFCCDCGGPLSLRIPERDDRHRHVCDTCGMVHYQNPRVVVCAIPIWNDKILLCRRAIEPRHGFWTLPGGFMENDESTLDTARRETFEEAGAHIEVGELFALFNLVQINQVQLFFRATLPEPVFAPGIESLEVALFAPGEIPWDELAFTSVSCTLREYFKDRAQGHYRLRVADILHPPGQERRIHPHNFAHD